MKFKVLLMVGLLLAATAGQAQPPSPPVVFLGVEFGVLPGKEMYVHRIFGLEIAGTIYDVTFNDGSFDSVYSAPASSALFKPTPFKNSDEAAAAASVVADFLNFFDNTHMEISGFTGNENVETDYLSWFFIPYWQELVDSNENVFTRTGFMNREGIVETEAYDYELPRSEANVDFYFHWVTFTPTSVSNGAPSANAGPDQSIRAGDVVFLDGSASDDDNTTTAMLEYEWLIISQPGGSVAVFDDSSSMMPTFEADVAGTYELRLVVTDEGGLHSEPDFVSISSSNLAPTAVATVDFALAVVGTTSFFDGSGSSDPELDEITYFWEITAAPLGSTAALVGAVTATPSLITDVEGAYEVTLTVSDDLGPGVPASVEFVATTPQNYAELMILDACDLIHALSPAQVTSKGNQTALCKFLKNATKDLQKGNVAKAIDDLNKALQRTDGCALRGSPDGNGEGRDWVVDCDAQYDIYNALRLAIDLLELGA